MYCSVPVFKNYEHYCNVSSRQLPLSSVSKFIPGYQQQRAQISGYIKKEIGFSLYDILKDDEHLVVRCGNLCSGYFEYGTLFFDNNNKMISSPKVTDTPYICHGGIRIYNYNCDPKIYNIKTSDNDDIIYFCVAEKRMNNNNYIWDRITFLLERI